MAEYKYFVHRDSEGKVIGWDMGPVSMTVEDHEKSNPGNLKYEHQSG